MKSLFSSRTAQCPIVADESLYAGTVIDNIAEGVITLDRNGIILSFNPAACAIFGWSAAEAIGRNITLLMPPDMRARHEQGLARYQAGQAPRIAGKGAVELPGLHKDGSRFQMELAINAIERGGRFAFVGIVRDIAERKVAQEILFSEKERLRVTLNSIADAVITTDTHNRITYINPVAQAMTGWRCEEAVGLPLGQVLRLSDDAGGAPGYRVLCDGARHAAWLTSRCGARLAIEESGAPILNARGEPEGTVMVFHDVSRIRQLAADMSYQASHDVLTGLINRREFEHRLCRLLDDDAAPAHDHTVLFMDLDQFKVVNDTCGHAAGDELLRQLSALMTAALRGGDALARLGGDEFGILFERCPLASALPIAEELRKVVAAFRYSYGGQVFSVSASIGLAAFRAGETTLGEAMRMADAACYMAKDKGRNRVHLHTPQDEEIARRHGEIAWVSRLRKALDDGRFVLYAQRMLSLWPMPGCAGRAGHHELLVRMVGENGELILPNVFIPAAERYGLMPLIDRWVIRQAFEQLARSADALVAGETFAINLSAASMADDDFLGFVLGQFDEHRIAPCNVCFEITETAAIANLGKATAFMLRLKTMGCRFALDDFGNGMASFAYLKQLPVDFLKLDGSFVRGCAGDAVDYAMVQAVNQIGHVLGMQTIAECAESEAVIETLRDIGVDFAQGHAIEAPRPWQPAARPRAVPAPVAMLATA